MSVNRVREFLEKHAPDIKVIELNQPTGTVDEAAKAFNVEPGQIAKSLTFLVNEDVIIIVMAGDRRLDNRKYKDYFGVKARMIPAEDVEVSTGFAPGGVSPLGIKENVQVYCDNSLKEFKEVLPAGGNANSGVRISPEHLSIITKSKWVDFSKEKTE